MKKIVFGLSLFLLFAKGLFAGEGMWIPMLLNSLNEKEMQAMGMRISVDDIYSVNHSSLKDAIVLFGSGCTAEIVSDQGLLFTNHHCGFGVIQKQSSLEHDYLTNGFWAMNKSEELPNPGLTVTMLMEMEDVTDFALTGVADVMTEAQRKEKITVNCKAIADKARQRSGFDAEVRSFFQDNQYFLLYTQTFKDIRLVGAPPSVIGKFGGDTDNWMWPRHTGDFSMFRIYVGNDNKPADYDVANVPYKPAYHLPISLKGVEEGDFTFVMGYPARTSEYLPSDAMELITEKSNPHRIQLRQSRLDIFGKYAATDPKVRLQYASKDANVANGWKKMIGESKGIRRMNGIEIKQSEEIGFTQWALANKSETANYTGLIPAFEKAYTQLEPLKIATDFQAEAGMGIELISFASKFRLLVDESKKASADGKKMEELIKSLKSQTTSFFKDYYQPIDREVATELISYYIQNQPVEFRPGFLNSINASSKNTINDYVNQLFDKSLFVNEMAVNELLTDFTMKKVKRIVNDPAYQIVMSMKEFTDNNISKSLKILNGSIDSLQRVYMKAQMEMHHDKLFYPDANFSLRVAYGNVKGFYPADGVYYDYYTTIDGIIEKDNPEILDYQVDTKLKQLYINKDYGRFADKDGRLRVAFAATNQTTGGNSGSPVLNADGQMVGINFDRCWEGTMSDLMYDPNMCRNISVDVRYMLFIIDKYAGAGHLINEMTLIE
ncbi:MAG: S46 family peptidase [Bacteroidales bacterium]|nr:S46 family peptidase [Bacteroidales bacterium]